MEFMLPSLISAGSSLIGGMMGQSGQAATNAQQLSMFNQQMQFNSAEAAKNRDFQERMSSTSYQRGMADMRAAGLNPILAAGMGGASSPAGGAGSIGGAPALGNPGAELGKGVSSAGRLGIEAVATKQALQTIDKDKSQTELNKAQDALAQETQQYQKQQTATSAAQMHAANATAANTQADTINKTIQSAIYGADAVTAAEKARFAKAQADQAEKWGPGVWGNLGGTVEKGLRRVIDATRSPNVINGSPASGSELPKWLSSDNPYVQQRIHNRRGVTVPASAPGGGLVIDMPR